MPNETPDSMGDYVKALLDSDLTLCPAGMNTETYRYESDVFWCIYYERGTCFLFSFHFREFSDRLLSLFTHKIH